MAKKPPTQQEIAEAAYHRYLKRAGQGGSDFDDWLEAERELASRSALDNPKAQIPRPKSQEAPKAPAKPRAPRKPKA